MPDSALRPNSGRPPARSKRKRLQSYCIHQHPGKFRVVRSETSDSEDASAVSVQRKHPLDDAYGEAPSSKDVKRDHKRSLLPSDDEDGSHGCDESESLAKAIQEMNVTLLARQLDSGAAVNVSTRSGESPLQLAIERNFRAGVFLLLACDRCTVDFQPMCGETALHTAIAQQNPYFTRLLLKQGASTVLENSQRRNAEQLAYGTRLAELVGLDAKQIAKLDKANRHGETLLHRASEHGDVQVATQQIWRGANVNAQCNAGHTPMHIAALEGHLDVVRLLVEHGGAINLRNHEGDTPLHDAATNSHLDVVKYLIEHGADPRISNLVGDLARDKLLDDTNEATDEIVRLLDLSAKDLRQRDVAIANEDGAGLNDLRRMSTDSASTNSVANSMTTSTKSQHRRNLTPNSHLYDDPQYKYKDGSGRMMIHTMIESQNFDGFVNLLEQGANRTSKDRDGRTPLHYAARAGVMPFVKLILEFPLADDGLGANINALNNKRETPLHESVGRYHTDVVEYLLEWGADPTLCDSEGVNAIQRAVSRGYDEQDSEVTILKTATSGSGQPLETVADTTAPQRNTLFSVNPMSQPSQSSTSSQNPCNGSSTIKTDVIADDMVSSLGVTTQSVNDEIEAPYRHDVTVGQSTGDICKSPDSPRDISSHIELVSAELLSGKEVDVRPLQNSTNRIPSLDTSSSSHTVSPLLSSHPGSPTNSLTPDFATKEPSAALHIESQIDLSKADVQSEITDYEGGAADKKAYASRLFRARLEQIFPKDGNREAKQAKRSIHRDQKLELTMPEAQPRYLPLVTESRYRSPLKVTPEPSRSGILGYFPLYTPIPTISSTPPAAPSESCISSAQSAQPHVEIHRRERRKSNAESMSINNILN